VSADYGECVIRALYDPLDGLQLHIQRADPVIRITPELLAEVPAPPSEHPATFDGKVLRIRGVNRTVIYRIRDVMEPVPGHFGMWDYIGEWPD
jgi:hypothetical protein